jgi:hypothetical protein
MPRQWSIGAKKERPRSMLDRGLDGGTVPGFRPYR